MINGRLIKTSLGTTKYCSHFMKNQPCPKPDCMYLHDLGDSEASFTKEVSVYMVTRTQGCLIKQIKFDFHGGLSAFTELQTLS
jgi:hypothetical protein